MGYTDLFSFYRSSEWETLRKIITTERVNKEGDLLCQRCGKSIIHPYDAICHHVVELDSQNVHDATIALNPDNIQVVCHKCHNKIHDRWQGFGGTRHVYVVWGSPCSGKAKYVLDSAGVNDLIIDYDRIYDALSIGHRWCVKANVMAVMNTLMDTVKTRNGKWKNVYIIRTLPMNIDRESIIKELGCGELIHIDTDHDTCLIEAKKRGGDWVEWVEQYWSRYQPPE